MEPLLDVRDLSVGYDRPLLHDISFRADPGEIVGILGRNGCGKTTLLRGLCGGIRRFSGRILIAGQGDTTMKLRQRAACISVLHQQTQVMEGISARQIMEMGRYPYADLHRGGAELVERSADLLGSTELLDADCAKLSQGQRQLVLLCRLLVQDTPVMLLDEPNAALDYDNTAAMFSILQNVVQEQEKTALLVLHDPELALAHCQRLLIMKEGRICRELMPAADDRAAVEEGLRQIYPNIAVRKDPFDGHFRCYQP